MTASDWSNVDFSEPEQDLHCALMLACLNGSHCIVKELMAAAGRSECWAIANKAGRVSGMNRDFAPIFCRPMQVACLHGHVKVVEVLLKVQDIKVNGLGHRGSLLARSGLATDMATQAHNEQGTLLHPSYDLMTSSTTVKAGAADHYDYHHSPGILHIACLNHNLELLQLLLSSPIVDPNDLDPKYGHPLGLLIKIDAGQPKAWGMFLQLISNPRLDINCRDMQGAAPIHILLSAVMRGQGIILPQDRALRLLQVLLSLQGIDVNAVDHERNWAPLHILSSNSNTLRSMCSLRRLDNSKIVEQRCQSIIHSGGAKAICSTIQKYDRDKQGCSRDQMLAMLKDSDIIPDSNNGGSPASQSHHCNVEEELFKMLLQHPDINLNLRTSYNSTALHLCFKNGLPCRVQALLRVPGIDANALDRDGETALHKASRARHAHVVATLLNIQHLILKRDLGYQSARVKKAMPGPFSFCHSPATLLESVAPTHSTGCCSLVPTNVTSAFHNDPPTVQPQQHQASTAMYYNAVSAVGATVNVNLKSQTDGNASALHLASREGQTEVVQALLLYGAATNLLDVNAMDSNGNTALHACVAAGHTAVVQVLLCWISHVQCHELATTVQQTTEGKGVLKLKSSVLWHEYISDKRRKEQEAFDRRAEVNNNKHEAASTCEPESTLKSADEDDCCVHYQSLSHGCRSCLTATHGYHYDVTADDEVQSDDELQSITVIDDCKATAAEAEALTCCQELVIPEESANSVAPCMNVKHASCRTREECAASLADEPCGSAAQQSSAHFQAEKKCPPKAMASDFCALMPYLHELRGSYNGSLITGLGGRTSCKHQEGSRILVNLNARNSRGLTPLHLACIGDHTEIVALLLQHPDSLDVNACDCWGETALHKACTSANLELVKMLCKSPYIDVNATDDVGNTCLHTSCKQLINRRRNAHIISFLLLMPGIQPELENAMSETALQFWPYQLV
ncbi:hypothetical protein CEUSTIGMA_g5947.t1 [Chlamydomonas eustigma]|uniref:Uncharacterized protein n=1 Tax=Chlamydomonas eustigma TaxID=1157962 RepID=A0A250X629_9CHLO|nr:hypothetical protein CEUSTIGMA_g5947.t1 [Chlamydomonas eustigma]|eukprot:GAX78508.1 hypothetical protein CEUSTIGMA_g5947.t1 [Chlamydomonas eustigma]